MYKVNENCIGCGWCVSLCPDVFQINDHDVSEVIVDEIPDGLEEIIKEAQVACPMQAIVEK